MTKQELIRKVLEQESVDKKVIDYILHLNSNKPEDTYVFEDDIGCGLVRHVVMDKPEVKPEIDRPEGADQWHIDNSDFNVYGRREMSSKEWIESLPEAYKNVFSYACGLSNPVSMYDALEYNFIMPRFQYLSTLDLKKFFRDLKFHYIDPKNNPLPPLPNNKEEDE